MLSKVVEELCEHAKQRPNVSVFRQYADKGIEVFYDKDFGMYSVFILVVTNDIFRTQTLTGSFREVNEVIKYVEKYINLKVEITNY